MLRLPQIDLAEVLKQPNPEIELRLEAYENSTRNFLKAVANYKNRAVTTITDRRNNQANEKKKIIERTAAIEVETNQCKLREIDLVADMEREKEERKDGELSVAAFKRQLETLRQKFSAIEVEIERYRAITANLRREKEKERSVLDAYASRLSPELQFCERHLACVVEGIEKDRLLVRFSKIDLLDPEREFSFVLDVSGRTYKVVTSSPPLPSLPILVDNLNGSGDIYDFIKQVRITFAAQVAPAT